MPTPSGHTRAITASKVQGTPVYNMSGEKIGKVEDVMLDKTSNNIMFAVLGFGGFLGIGEKFHPVPWPVLDYDPQRDGYVVPFSKEELRQAPAYSRDELTKDDGNVRSSSFTYYKVDPYWQ